MRSKSWKRLLSAVLVVMMIVSLLPVVAIPAAAAVDITGTGVFKFDYSKLTTPDADKTQLTDSELASKADLGSGYFKVEQGECTGTTGAYVRTNGAHLEIDPKDVAGLYFTVPANGTATAVVGVRSNNASKWSAVGLRKGGLSGDLVPYSSLADSAALKGLTAENAVAESGDTGVKVAVKGSSELKVTWNNLETGTYYIVSPDCGSSLHMDSGSDSNDTPDARVVRIVSIEVKQTVVDPNATSAPSLANNGLCQLVEGQADATFTLSAAVAEGDSMVYKLYSAAEGGTAVATSAAVTTGTTITFTGFVTPGSYFMSAKNGEKNESTERTACQIKAPAVAVNSVAIARQDDATITNKTVEIVKGQSLQLKAVTDPVGANVTWSSDRAVAASVSNAGLVTAVGVGQAVITLTADDDDTKTDTLKVNVVMADDTGNVHTFDSKNLSYNADADSSKDTLLMGTVDGSGNGNDVKADYKTGSKAMKYNNFFSLGAHKGAFVDATSAKWTEPEALTSYKGMFTGGSAGSVKFSSDKALQVKMWVHTNKKSLILEQGTTVLKTISGDSSKDEALGATVYVPAPEQSANYTVRRSDGGAYISKVVVTEFDTVTTAITDGDQSVAVGGDLTLAATVTTNPSASVPQDVTWASSEETVATVAENGAVTPIKAGETTITATSTALGAVGTITLTVTDGSSASATESEAAAAELIEALELPDSTALTAVSFNTTLDNGTTIDGETSDTALKAFVKGVIEAKLSAATLQKVDVAVTTATFAAAGSRAVETVGTVTYAATLTSKTDEEDTATISGTITLQAEQSTPPAEAENTYTFDMDDVEKYIDGSLMTGAVIDGFFTLNGVVINQPQYKTSKFIELGRNNGGAIEFTVKGSGATVTVEYSSSGTSNPAAEVHLRTKAAEIGGGTAVTPKSGEETNQTSTKSAVVYEITGLNEPTTYSLSGVASGNRETRIYSVTVKAKEPTDTCTHEHTTPAATGANAAQAATCTAGGYLAADICDDCGAVVNSRIPTAPAGHTFSGGVGVKCDNCSVICPESLMITARESCIKSGFDGTALGIEGSSNNAKGSANGFITNFGYNNTNNGSADTEYTIGGITFNKNADGAVSKYFKFNSTGVLSFKAPADGTVTLYANSNDSSKISGVQVDYTEEGTDKDLTTDTFPAAGGTATFDVVAGTVYTLRQSTASGAGQVNLYALVFEAASSGTETTDAPEFAVDGAAWTAASKTDKSAVFTLKDAAPANTTYKLYDGQGTAIGDPVSATGSPAVTLTFPLETVTTGTDYVVKATTEGKSESEGTAVSITAFTATFTAKTWNKDNMDGLTKEDGTAYTSINGNYIVGSNTSKFFVPIDVPCKVKVTFCFSADGKVGDMAFYTGSGSTSAAEYQTYTATADDVETGVAIETFGNTYITEIKLVALDDSSDTNAVGVNKVDVSRTKAELQMTKFSTTVITAIANGKGTVTATSDTEGVATVAVDGKKITVTAKSAGTANVTVKLGAGGTADTEKTVAVTVLAADAPKATSWDFTTDGVSPNIKYADENAIRDVTITNGVKHSTSGVALNAGGTVTIPVAGPGVIEVVPTFTWDLPLPADTTLGDGSSPVLCAKNSGTATGNDKIIYVYTGTGTTFTLTAGDTTNATPSYIKSIEYKALDKSTLTDAIAEAQAILDAEKTVAAAQADEWVISTDGLDVPTNVNWTTAEAKATLTTAIATATAALGTVTTDAEVAAAVAALKADNTGAIATFVATWAKGTRKAAATITAPTGDAAKYNGQAKTLTVTGVTEGATVEFKVKDANDSTYTTDVPTATNVSDTKTYTYRVTAATYVTLTGDVKLEVTQATWDGEPAVADSLNGVISYKGGEVVFTVTGVPAGGTLTGSCSVGTNFNLTYDASTQSWKGTNTIAENASGDTHTVTFTYTNGNYNAISVPQHTITQNNSATLTAEAPASLQLGRSDYAQYGIAGEIEANEVELTVTESALLKAWADTEKHAVLSVDPGSFCDGNSLWVKVMFEVPEGFNKNTWKIYSAATETAVKEKAAEYTGYDIQTSGGKTYFVEWIGVADVASDVLTVRASRNVGSLYYLFNDGTDDKAISVIKVNVVKVDKTDLTAAKAAVPTTYDAVAQASVDDQTAAENIVKGILDKALAEYIAAGVSYELTDVTYTASTPGTLSNEAGTDGSLAFKVKLSHDNAMADETTGEFTMTITATAYTPQDVTFGVTLGDGVASVTYQVGTATPVTLTATNANITGVKDTDTVTITGITYAEGYKAKDDGITGVGAVTDGKYPVTIANGAAAVSVTAEAIEYTINYTLDGGSTTNPATFVVTDLPITLADATGKTGFTFKGWTGEGTAEATKNLQITTVGNKTYTAVWEQDQQTGAKTSWAAADLADSFFTGTNDKGDKTVVITDANKVIETGVDGIELTLGVSSANTMPYTLNTKDEDVLPYGAYTAFLQGSDNPSPNKEDNDPTSGSFYTVKTTKAGKLAVDVAALSGNSTKPLYIRKNSSTTVFTLPGSPKSSGTAILDAEANDVFVITVKGGSKPGLLGLSFPVESHTISATGVEHGTVAFKVNGNTATSAYRNQTVVVEPTLDNGYIVTAVTCNGTPAAVNADGKYAFLMPDANATVAVTVGQGDIALTGINATSDAVTIVGTAGKTATVTLSKDPANSTDKLKIATQPNSSVATVDLNEETGVLTITAVAGGKTSVVISGNTATSVTKTISISVTEGVSLDPAAFIAAGITHADDNNSPLTQVQVTANAPGFTVTNSLTLRNAQYFHLVKSSTPGAVTFTVPKGKTANMEIKLCSNGSGNTSAGTLSYSGTATDLPTGKLVARASATASEDTEREVTIGSAFQVFTTTAGIMTFSALPAGDYTLTAGTAGSDLRLYYINVTFANVGGTVEADKDALTTAISTAQGKVPASDKIIDKAEAEVDVGTEYWTTEAVTALNTAITTAQGVAADENATQDEVDAAVTALNGAVTTFEDAKKIGTKDSGTTPPAPSVDKSALNTAITAAQGKVPAKANIIDKAEAEVAAGTEYWTNAAVTALNNAITTAQGVKNKASATQDEVDAAVTALNSAVDTFVAAKKTGTKNDMTLNKSSVNVSVNGTASVTATVVGYVGKTVKVISDNASVATATVSGTSITVKGQAEGSANIYVIMSDASTVTVDAAKADPSLKVIAVTVKKDSTNPGGGGGSTRPADRTEEPTTPATTPGTVTKPDGTQVKTEVAKDGTVTVNTTNPDGSKTESVKKPDGEVEITATTAEGEVIAEVTIPATTPSVRHKFVDVPDDHWAAPAINRMAGMDLVKGVDDVNHIYDMNSAITRGAVATVLFRFSNGKTDLPINFSDVAENDWYADGVAWANKAGVVTGFENGTYQAEQAITRQQLAVMITRYAKLVGLDVSTSRDLTGFVDGVNVPTWAIDGVAWCVKAGIMNGKGNATLDPTAPATRAEAAAMMSRFIDLMK